MTENLEIKSIETIKANILLALEKVRPHLLLDGGDIEFVEYEEYNRVAVVRFIGNCIDCPLSMMTLRGGIERYILYYEPSVRRVEAIK